jgi:hypothetical protein
MTLAGSQSFHCPHCTHYKLGPIAPAVSPIAVFQAASQDEEMLTKRFGGEVPSSYIDVLASLPFGIFHSEILR